MSLKPLVPIFMGSNSDSKHCESIAKELAVKKENIIEIWD